MRKQVLAVVFTCLTTIAQAGSITFSVSPGGLTKTQTLTDGDTTWTAVTTAA